MNYSAYLATGQMIALMQSFSKIRVMTHGQESIPDGSIIFVVNHFTRIETLLLPYHIHAQTGAPVWSLADHSLFEGPLSGFLEKVGAVSTRNPDRDLLIVKSLLTGEANWIIFPEGRMVKDKEAPSNPAFFGIYGRDGWRAHTGAATLALRTEFYRTRLKHLLDSKPSEAERLKNMFRIEDLEPVLNRKTWIVPVNLTYYPLRARENVLSTLADRFARNLSDRMREELLTEGTMFFDGVDIDFRFGKGIPVSESLASPAIKADILSPEQINFDDVLPSISEMRSEAASLMQRFMDDIYKMTTVNHDHLFASLLKALPFDRISERDFRRRVFLLTKLLPGEMSVFCHHSLKNSQLSLLTDDRHHKYLDFLKLARESGVVRSREGYLHRISANLSEESEFHRIRIENPIGVIANEVHPLKTLRQKVRRLAWLPKILVRHEVVDVLLSEAARQFESDYSEHHIPDESKEPALGAPILLKGNSRRMGIVLLHGFLAAPREMAQLADYLNKKGFWVYCARVRGHGTSPEDLATRKKVDWIESVDLGYALMSSICRRVAVGGFSFGGGLALDAAARIPGVAGVFAVSPPFRLREFSARLASTVTAWNRVVNSVHFHNAAKEFVENIPERPEINYTRIPLAALAEMKDYMEDIADRLADVSSPTLVIQGSEDPVVCPEETAIKFNSIGTAAKEYISFDFNRHGILAGEGSESVHAAIAGFVQHL